MNMRTQSYTGGNLVEKHINTAYDTVRLVAEEIANGNLLKAATAAADTAGDVAITNADVVTTNADVVATNADAALTNADAASTNADVSSTNADAVTTAADALATAADVVLTNAVLADFETKYLGAKSANPTLDNAGGTLIDGASYFNNTAAELRIYKLSNTTWYAFTTYSAADIKSLYESNSDTNEFSDAEKTKLAGAAPLASPALTGNPTAPTQTPGDNSTKVATTAFVQAATGVSFRGAFVRYNDVGLADAVTTDVSWGAEEYDTDNIHDLTTNKSRLVVPAGVTKVRIKALVQWPANSTGYRQATIHKNGAVFQGSAFQREDSPSSTVSTIQWLETPVIEVVADQYFTISGYQTSGLTLSLIGGSNSSWFSMEIVE